MKYLALCCIVKDEDHFIKEWIAYHALLGVEHFYIYDNMSKMPVADLLGDYVSPRTVTIRRLAGQAMQMFAYQNCLDDFGPSCRWIGFIDVDEFVCPIVDTDIRVLLSEFEEYAGLGVTWKIFSSGGHLGRPAGPVVKNYTQAFPARDTAESVHIKSFLDPSRVLSSYNPHRFALAPQEIMVNEDHFPIPVDAPFTFSRNRKVALHHYYYRSQQDFEEKITRGRADIGKGLPMRALADFYHHAKNAYTECNDALHIVPQLEKSLASPTLHEAKMQCPSDTEYHRFMDTALELGTAGQPEKAQAYLCHAIPRFSEQCDVWVLRAMLARISGKLERAERFIRYALRFEEVPNAYLELIAVWRAQNRIAEADALQGFLKNLLTIRVKK